MSDAVLVGSGEKWAGTDHSPAACPQCSRLYLVPSAALPACPDCGAAALEAATTKVRAEPPEQVVRFQLDHAELLEALQRFAQPVRFRPDGLDGELMAKRAVQVWWPSWLVDATVAGHWRAEAGYPYEVESARESFDGGRWRSETRIETRLRWDERVGEMRRRYDNVAVDALTEPAAAVLELTASARQTNPFSPRAMAGVAVRVPEVRPDTAWPAAEEALRTAAGVDCAKAAGADDVRDFYLSAQFDQVVWTWRLHPLWTTWWVDDDEVRHRVLVDGATGRVVGMRLASVQKGTAWAIGFAVAASVCFAVGALTTLVGVVFLPLLALSMIAFAIALVLIVIAIVPLVSPRIYNRHASDLTVA